MTAQRCFSRTWRNLKDHMMPMESRAPYHSFCLNNWKTHSQQSLLSDNLNTWINNLGVEISLHPFVLLPNTVCTRVNAYASLTKLSYLLLWDESAQKQNIFSNLLSAPSQGMHPSSGHQDFEKSFLSVFIFYNQINSIIQLKYQNNSSTRMYWYPSPFYFLKRRASQLLVKNAVGIPHKKNSSCCSTC